MTENTFPVYTADAIVNFYRTEVLTGQEAKHFTKSDLTPHPKVRSAWCYRFYLQNVPRFKKKTKAWKGKLHNELEGLIVIWLER